MRDPLPPHLGELWPLWREHRACIHTHTHTLTSALSSLAFGYWSPFFQQPAKPTQALLLLEAFPGCQLSTGTPPRSPQDPLLVSEYHLPARVKIPAPPQTGSMIPCEWLTHTEHHIARG